MLFLFASLEVPRVELRAYNRCWHRGFRRFSFQRDISNHFIQGKIYYPNKSGSSTADPIVRFYNCIARHYPFDFAKLSYQFQVPNNIYGFIRDNYSKFILTPENH